MPTTTSPDIRRVVTAFVLQLLFTLAAVAVSRVAPGPRERALLVLGLALLNVATVSWMAMGLNRERWLVVAMVALVCVFAAGLLLWPAWDIYERVAVIR